MIVGNLSLNFSAWEFDCTHCGHVVGPTHVLIDSLQRLRTMKGQPLKIVSAYRCATFNKRVGGIERSEHRAGNAVDVPRGYCTVEEATRAGFHGIGVRRGGVIHLDMTPGWSVGHVFQE